jgi:hypothetical protein
MELHCFLLVPKGLRGAWDSSGVENHGHGTNDQWPMLKECQSSTIGGDKVDGKVRDKGFGVAVCHGSAEIVTGRVTGGDS